MPINAYTAQPYSPEQDGKFIFSQGKEQFYPREANGNGYNTPSAAEIMHTPDPEIEARIHAATAKELATSIHPEDTRTPETFDAAQAIESMNIIGQRIEHFYRREDLELIG